MTEPVSVERSYVIASEREYLHALLKLEELGVHTVGTATLGETYHLEVEGDPGVIDRVMGSLAPSAEEVK